MIKHLFVFNPLPISASRLLSLIASSFTCVPGAIPFMLHWTHCVCCRIFREAFFKPAIMGLKNIHHAMNAHLCVLLVPDFQVEVQLDSNKYKQKSVVKRALFLDSQQPLLQRRVVVRHGERVCNNTKIYLRVGPLLMLLVYRVSQTLIKITWRK